MKLVIDKNELAAAIQIVVRAVPSKTTMPILECILIDASSDQIKLIANDMELGIETVVKGTIEERGIVAIDAGIFSNLVRKLPDSDVHITTNVDHVSIVCENARFNILGRDGSDFAYLPEIERREGITLSQLSLRDMITKTIFSISSNESNKMMTGELLEIHGDTLRVVALDGHRISIRKIELPEVYPDRKVIIPGKTLNEINKILTGSADKQVQIFFTDKHVLFEIDESLVVSRLIEGDYFRIDQMLSTDYETRIRINRQEFLSCIDRATLLVKEDDKKPIILMIRDENMELRINTTLGSMNEVIDIEKSGSDLNIGFNPKFLIDALRAISDEEVTIYLLSQKAPCFIRNDVEEKREDSSEKQEYCYLILPVNFISID